MEESGKGSVGSQEGEILINAGIRTDRDRPILSRSMIRNTGSGSLHHTSMNLYSYIVADDTGFSPNPFWGYCTLACCKPVIRRTAQVGDWIAGLSPKSAGNRIVFAMQVNEILSYADYYRDERFAAKIPRFNEGKVVFKCGDNIYEPLPNGDFRQLQSMHSKDKGPEEDLGTKKHDLRGANTLIATTFHYFGSNGPELPRDLHELKVGRGHKKFPREVAMKFQSFIVSFPAGICSPPGKWPKDDNSWRPGQE